MSSITDIDDLFPQFKATRQKGPLSIMTQN